MKTLEDFGEALTDFILGGRLEKRDTGFYEDALLNFIAVTYAGSQADAVKILAKTAQSDAIGNYQPLGRKEKLSLSSVIAIDCFSSAIEAYDDIHFQTTTHPCGPVASALLGMAREKAISKEDLLEALMIGMEIECRLALIMGNMGGLYPTGITGGIGATAALCHLNHDDRVTTQNALALAASYACGNRGTHGSMAGSYVPAIAAVNGYRAYRLAKQGFTCSINSLIGQNGLILAVTSEPAIAAAEEDLGVRLISMDTSCKPYPYGFITFATIDALRQFPPLQNVTRVTLRVSKRVYDLGHRAFPKTQYEGLISLPYITSRVILNPAQLYRPLDDNFKLDEQEQALMRHIEMISDKTLSDDEAAIEIIAGGKSYKASCDQPLGSAKRPMTRDDILGKAKKISFIDDGFLADYYQEQINDIHHFIQRED